MKTFILSLLLLAVALTVTADRRAILIARNNSNTAAGDAFDPSQISGILQFNYGGGDASGAGVDQTWTATVGQNLTTDATTGRPTKSTTSISGKSTPTYSFNGTANYMTNGGAWTATQPYTRFATFRLTDNTFPTSRFLCAGDEAGRADLRSDASPVYSLYCSGSFQNFSAIPNTNWNILVQIIDGANTRIQINGAAWDVIAGSPGTDTITGSCLGALYNGGGVINPAAVNFECYGVISNTNYATWGQSLTNWQHDGIYGSR